MSNGTWKSPSATIEAEVLVSGDPLPLYVRPDGRPFAAGVPGTAYTVRVRNLTRARVEVILTVDGRHALRDEPGDHYACRGLVIPACGSHEFPGWQLDDREAGQFKFTDPSAGVAAAATGSSEHAGQIGFAVHRERAEVVATYNSILRRRPAPAAGMTGRASLGTGIGATVSSPLGRTKFERDGNPPDLLVIGYGTEAALRAQGIIPAAPEADPHAFPGQGTGYRRYQP